MIRNDEQLYAQLHLETRLSPARKDALFARIRHEAASGPQKKTIRWKWDLFRTAAATVCVAAMAFSIHMLRQQLPAAETGSSSMESVLEEVRSDSVPTTGIAAGTTTAVISGIEYTEQTAQTQTTQTTAVTKPAVSGEPAKGQAGTDTTTVTAASLPSGTGTSATSSAAAISAATTALHTTSETAMPATTTTSAPQQSAETTETTAQQANGRFCMEEVTCRAGDTFTLRLYAAEDLTLDGTVLDLDIENEIVDCAVPSYVGINAVWFNDTDQEYSWNPPTLALAPASTAAAVVPKDTCLLELTMNMPQNVPAGTVYTVYMSEYQSPENGGKLLCEPYVLCTVTVQ